MVYVLLFCCCRVALLLRLLAAVLLLRLLVVCCVLLCRCVLEPGLSSGPWVCLGAVVGVIMRVSLRNLPTQSLYC
jgi:hypothetical protein